MTPGPPVPPPSSTTATARERFSGETLPGTTLGVVVVLLVARKFLGLSDEELRDLDRYLRAL